MAMNKISLIMGIHSLGVALILFLLELNVYKGVLGSINVSIYATWFFVLLGGLLILRSFFNRRPAQ
jgi:hypothetical protein